MQEWTHGNEEQEYSVQLSLLRFNVGMMTINHIHINLRKYLGDLYYLK